MTKPKLKNLIDKHTWYYKNENITEKNFPVPKKIETENWKIIRFDKSFTSKEALDRIKSEGCRPANVYELLTFKKNHPEIWPDNTWTSVIAFGQTWKDSDRNHRVPHVLRDSDGDFEFSLGYFERDWRSDACVLCFCDSTLAPKTLKDSDSLTLPDELIINNIKYKKI
jgi:hypothetical protein